MDFLIVAGFKISRVESLPWTPVCSGLVGRQLTHRLGNFIGGFRDGRDVITQIAGHTVNAKSHSADHVVNVSVNLTLRGQVAGAHCINNLDNVS